MINVEETTVHRRIAAYFLRNAEQAQRTFNNIRSAPLPSNVAAGAQTQGQGQGEREKGARRDGQHGPRREGGAGQGGAGGDKKTGGAAWQSKSRVRIAA